MSKLILGTVQFGLLYGINNTSGRPSTTEVAKILDFAAGAGIRTLDTADAYGDCQEILSETTAFKFDILSKFIFSEDNKSISRNLEETLRRIGRNALTGYSFHRFHDFKNYDSDEVPMLKERGLVKKIGVSLHSSEELNFAVETPWIDLIQLPLNLLDHVGRKEGLLQKAKAAGKEIHVRSVFLQGLLFKDPDGLPQNLAPLRESIFKIRELADRNQMTIRQLCLGYALSQSCIDGVVIGVESLKQLQENIESTRQTTWTSTLTSEIESIRVDEPALLNPASWSSP